MNTSTNPQQNQLNPDQTGAALAFATNLMRQTLPEPSQTPNPAQGAPQNQQTPEDVQLQIQGLESRLMDELQTLKTEMKDQGDGKQELADLKKQIEAVLNSND